MNYQIKRNDTVIAGVAATGNQQKAIMGTNIVSMSFTLHEYVEFLRGDYCEVYDERYYLIDNAGKPKQENSLDWTYNLEFQSQPYTLKKAQYQFYGDDTKVKEPDFSLTATARGFLELMITNISRISPGWAMGTVDETEAKTLSFSAGDNCLSVLSRLAEEYNTEWWVEGKVIHLAKRGEVLPVVLDFGPGKGYRNIERVPIDGKPPVTRLFVFGSTKNIPADYRGLSKRLKMPSGLAPNYCIEKNVNLYGIWEDTKIFDDVYPHRLGTVSSVQANNTFTDAGIDFNVNNHLIAGTSAKIIFRTGRLAGYQFELAPGGYNHSTKQFTFLKDQDEKALEIPSDTLKPQAGDQYVLIDLVMPDTYIASGETELYNKGLEYLNLNAGDHYNYEITLDPFHFRREGLYLQLGKYIHIKSEKFNLDSDLRIVGFTRDLQDPYVYSSVSVSDSVQISPALTADSQQREIERAIQLNELTDVNRARRNRKTSAEMMNMIFDPGSGMVRNDKVDVDYIRTQVLTVGTQSQDFQLTVTFLQSDQANTNRFSWSAGKLIHYIIDDNGGTWNIQAGSVTGLDPAKAYYIYAKSNRFSPGAQILLSEEKIAFDSVPDYYHFWIGVLSSVTDGLRDTISLYGITEVSGRRIRTGEFVNTSSQPVLNLDTRTFYGSFKFSNGADVKQVTDDLGSGLNEVRQIAENTEEYMRSVLPGKLSDLQDQIDGAIESYFQEQDPSASNYPASQWNTSELKERHANDTYTNTATGASWRWVYENNNWTWKIITDTATQKALVMAGQAKDTADKKRRTFVAPPVPPYDEGDLWAQGSNGELMRCITGRQAGNYNASDWEKASKYTDDTVVNNLSIGGRNLLRNTNNFKNHDHWYNNGGGIAVNGSFDQDGSPALQTSMPSGITGDWYRIEPDTEYTYSAWLYSDEQLNAGGNTPLNFWISANQSSGDRYTITKPCESFPARVWSKVYITFKTAVDGIWFKPFLYMGQNSGYLYATHLKLEKGNKPTDWTPAPEDVASDAQVKADAAQQAAMAAANAKAEYEREVAKAYADNKVTAEEQRAINDAQAKLDEAKTYAEQKAVSGEIYVRGTGLNNNASPLIKINGNQSDITMSRGHNLVRLNRYTLAEIERSGYDTYVVPGNSALLSKLQSIGTDEIIILASYDACSINTEIAGELKRFGGTGKTFGADRFPYAFIGIAGLGEGKGYERIEGTEANAPYAEISVKVSNAQFTGNSQTSVSLASDAKSAAEAASQTAAQAKAQADNAINTANNAAVKTNFLSTSIDGNVVATGTLLVGDATNNNNAGITGVVDNGDQSVRFFAGSTYANRNSAPYRIQNNGKVYMSDAEISGKINADSGTIGGFDVSNGMMQTAGVTGSQPKFVLFPNGQSGYLAFVDNAGGKWAGIGSNVLPATSGVEAVSRFENTKSNPYSINYGIYANVTGASKNVALHIANGAVRFGGATYQKITRVDDAGYACSNDDHYVILTAGGSYWVYFPPDPSTGREIIFRRFYNNGTVTIQGNGHNIWVSNSPQSSRNMGWGERYVFDGSYWVLIDAFS